MFLPTDLLHMVNARGIHIATDLDSQNPDTITAGRLLMAITRRLHIVWAVWLGVEVRK